MTKCSGAVAVGVAVGVAVAHMRPNYFMQPKIEIKFKPVFKRNLRRLEFYETEKLEEIKKLVFWFLPSQKRRETQPRNFELTKKEIDFSRCQIWFCSKYFLSLSLSPSNTHTHTLSPALSNCRRSNKNWKKKLPALKSASLYYSTWQNF